MHLPVCLLFDATKILGSRDSISLFVLYLLGIAQCLALRTQWEGGKEGGGEGRLVVVVVSRIQTYPIVLSC